MKKFIEFVTEIFDTPVKVKKKKSISPHHHIYSFKHNGVPYSVHVYHSFMDKKRADVDFEDTGRDEEEATTTTGSQRYSASGVISGVHKALRMHNEEHPHIEHYAFDSSLEKNSEVNPARDKLYAAITRRAKGKVYGSSFKIPASALRK
jgi:hypothetical protein